MAKPKPRIHFPAPDGSYQPWVAVVQVQADALARMDLPGRALRTLIAALSRMERSGHAHFQRGELRHILADVNRSTGQVTPVHRETVVRAVDALVNDGVLLPGSWSCDLRVSSTYAQRAEGERTDCPTKPKGARTMPKGARTIPTRSVTHAAAA